MFGVSVNQRTTRSRRRPTARGTSSSLADSANNDNDELISSMFLHYFPKPALRAKQRNVLLIMLLVVTTCLASVGRITRHYSQEIFRDQVAIARAKRVQQKSSSGATKYSDCSCWNKSDKCCDRKVLRAHKMGVVLIRDLIQTPINIESATISPSVLNQTVKKDYRHVVITRPIYDSIISGYLYHMSGRECWLDQHGNARSQNKTFEWESKLSHQSLVVHPRKNRTLCAYLSEESETDGMRVMVDLALSSWYAGLIPHYKLVKQVETQSNPHTIFVCFEELSNPATQEATIQKITNWLYPGGHAYVLSRQAKQTSLYNGGHSTNSDAKERVRLFNLVRRFDEELFHGMGSEITSTFGCNKKSIT